MGGGGVGIVLKCSFCSETETDANFLWVPNTIYHSLDLGCRAVLMSHKDFIFVPSGQGHYKAVDTVTKVTGDIEGERIVQVSSKADTVLAVSGMYHGLGGGVRYVP